MAWIEPLKLETWLVNVFAGDATYFSAIAIFFIMGLAGYFRMSTLSMFFMAGVFLLLFSEVVPMSLTIFIAIVGGLVVGLVVSRIVKS